MLSFDKTQLAAIEASFRAQRRKRLAARFHEVYPRLAGQKTEADLIAYLDLVIEDGKPLGIIENEQLLECAAIGLVAQQPDFPTETVVLIARTLNQLTWEPELRLNFIRQNLLPSGALEP